jgi:catechol 2,3-dioxygenase
MLELSSRRRIVTAIDTPERPLAVGLVPDSTRLGPVHIAVTEGERALSVWRDLVGLSVLAQDDKTIALGAGGTPLIVLETGAKRPVVPNTAGLYHVAIHVPTRKDLAIVIARLFARQFRNSPTDHLVTETTYLWDLDGNGIEMTFETPWRGTLVTDGLGFRGVTKDGKAHSGREPVDLDSLFAELGPDENLDMPLPAGTRIGHIHLHVADLEGAMDFYSGVLGFKHQMLSPSFRMGDVTVSFPPHIIAWNTWAGEGAKQPPPNSAGLRRFTIRLPDARSLGEMHARLHAASAPMIALGNSAFETADPSGNRIRVELTG